MTVMSENFEKLFDKRKYGHDWVLRMVCRLLENVLALEEFVRHQPAIILLEASEHVSHDVFDGFRCAVLDI